MKRIALGSLATLGLLAAASPAFAGIAGVPEPGGMAIGALALGVAALGARLLRGR